MSQYVTDYRTGAIDRIPATYWSDLLETRKPMPQDKEFWIVTWEGEAHEVSFYDDAKYWTGRDTYARNDGEAGSWEPDEIAGWTLDGEDAEEAATLLAPLAPATTCIETTGGDPETALRLSFQIKVF